MQFQFSLSLLLITLVLLIQFKCEAAASCGCMELDIDQTKDCCLGTSGVVREEDDGKCYFTDYNLMASFNRCCDSFGSKVKCERAE
jgi:hypothetical protein